jgi:hypothetical protein
MEDWVLRGMQRWPNVPALFGWLGLDRRGRWTIQGELISRPQIIDTINANYAADELGRWYFQNGPQRGYVALEVAPLILSTSGDGSQLLTHTGLRVESVMQAWLDESGSLLLSTEHGAGLLADADLAWALSRIETSNGAVDDAGLEQALAESSGSRTLLKLMLDGRGIPITRLDNAEIPAALGFVRVPQGEAGTSMTGLHP